MNIEEIENALKGAKYNHCGLPVIEIYGAEYAVARSAEEAYAAACNAVGESLWAFDPEFVLSQCGIYFGGSATMAFGKMLSNVCEEGNDFVRALIDGTCGFENFCSEAIFEDGEGHFLATYDGKELEISDGKRKKFFLYRIS